MNDLNELAKSLSEGSQPAHVRDLLGKPYVIVRWSETSDRAFTPDDARKLDRGIPVSPAYSTELAGAYYVATGRRLDDA